MWIELYNIGKRDSVSMKFTCIVSLQVMLRSLKQETVHNIPLHKS